MSKPKPASRMLKSIAHARVALGVIALSGSGAALAQAPSPPAPDTPEVQALKAEYLDAIQKQLNTRTAYAALQSQIGKLQAAIQEKQAKIAELEAKPAPPGGGKPLDERPAGTVAGGDAGSPK